jgi:regulator of replication initiation timing
MGDTMNPTERKLIYSFGLARKDIMSLQQNVVDLARNQRDLSMEIDKLKAQVSKNSNKPVTKKVAIVKKASTTRKKASFIASKTGNKFHVESCPFGQNILPKMKLRFNSKIKALNKGLKPCRCVK